jgi:hypothetical protein
MNAVNDTKPVDETFVAQPNYQLNGPVSVFITVQATNDGVPVAELTAFNNRQRVGQLDRLEVADAMLKLVRRSVLPGYVTS